MLSRWRLQFSDTPYLALAHLLTYLASLQVLYHLQLPQRGGHELPNVTLRGSSQRSKGAHDPRLSPIPRPTVARYYVSDCTVRSLLSWPTTLLTMTGCTIMASAPDGWFPSTRVGTCRPPHAPSFLASEKIFFSSHGPDNAHAPYILDKSLPLSHGVASLSKLTILKTNTPYTDIYILAVLSPFFQNSIYQLPPQRLPSPVLLNSSPFYTTL